MDVLVVGSGAREHALLWKLKQSPRAGKLYAAPGNGGTVSLAENVPIGVMEFEKLAAFAKEKNIGLTISGPDDAFVGGIVDVFKKHNLRVWGPTKEAAQIEGSKAFSKQLMHESKIPTAEFAVFTAAAPALAYVHAHGVPIVIKASGLALGKGVYVCSKFEEAEKAINEIMIERVHKDAGGEVVVEEFLEGPEMSVHALTDGIAYVLFPSSQDHKAALDGDQGKNTGGMGTLAPVPWAKPDTMATIDGTIPAIRPSVVWEPGFAANIVIASGGYPEEYKTGFPVTGIDDARSVDGVVVFHAGTRSEDGQLVTAGGRVLSVSATGGTLKEALDRAYAAVGKIHFEGMHFRRDIGTKSLA